MKTEKLKTKKHGVRYPWGEWLQPGTRVLKKGEDYEGESHGFAMTIRQAGYRTKGVKVSLRVGDNQVEMTVTKGD